MLPCTGNSGFLASFRTTGHRVEVSHLWLYRWNGEKVAYSMPIGVNVL